MVVDTSALVAILLGEEQADALSQSLANADAAVISAPNWLETMIVVRARLGEPGTQALLQLMDAAQLMIEPADAALVQRAWAAWQRYGKGRHPAGLNFGDCFAFALAAIRGEPLLFKGEDFALTDLRPA